jgi:hypothetical protein
MQADTAPTMTTTQNETIRAHLLAGESISTWQAYELYNITCLAQRIHELRNAGLPIQSELVTKNGKRFSLYWLGADDIGGAQ